MDTLPTSGTERESVVDDKKDNQNKKKKKGPLSKLLLRSSDETKRQTNPDTTSSVEKKKQHQQKATNIKDIPIVAGMSAGSSNDEGRKNGLSEKCESDRDVVKKILSDMIRQENMDSLAL